MRKVVDHEQIAAIMRTRKVMSPGGVAQKLGISRQRVMQMVEKPGKRGWLAWCAPLKRPWFRAQYYVYVDMGPQGEILDDPTSWRNEDLDELLRVAMREFADHMATRASTESGTDS